MELMMVVSTLRGALAGAGEKIDRKRLLQESQILNVINTTNQLLASQL